MRKRLLLPLLLAAATFAAPANAQMVVTDTGAYTRMLSQLNQARAQLAELQTQVRQGAEMVDQGKRLYAGMTGLTNVNSLGGVLNNPALRQYLPAEVQDTGKLLNGTLTDLGSIGSRAAMEEAAALAKALGVGVIVAFGYATTAMGGENRDEELSIRAMGQSVANEAEAYIASAGVQVTVELVHDRPAAGILDELAA